VDDPALLDVLDAAAAAVREALAVLHRAGLAVLSEESGLTGDSSAELVVLDPLDGSTNAARGIPWYATSLCVIDDEGPRVAVVVDQARGVRFEAVRGGGARRAGHPLAPSGCRRLADAVVGVSGLPASSPGWAQFRALGAAALDLCAVAGGVLDGYRPVGTSWLHPWDYLGGVLVCQEAGAVVGEAGGAELVVREAARRRPVAAATPELLAALIAAEP
jgi:myo-inositol-1(or 4)-monophosphatase